MVPETSWEVIHLSEFVDPVRIVWALHPVPASAM